MAILYLLKILECGDIRTVIDLAGRKTVINTVARDEFNGNAIPIP